VKFPPPLLSTQPRAAQIFSAVVLPIAAGALCGVLLGVNEAAYLIVSLITIAGGFSAGYEHMGAGAGARRGVFGGTLFGSCILIAHEIHGHAAKADLPHPGILLVLITATLGAILGALGGRLRARREGAQAVT
jgi:Na+/H+ antiporter NhaA